MRDDLFEALGEERSQRLVELGRPRRYPAGSTLFTEGEISDRVVVVLDGLVKVSFFTDDGKEVLLAVRGRGEALGDMAALDGEPRSATVTALTDADTVVLSAEGFRSFLSSDGDTTLVMLGHLSRRLRDADRKRIEFGALDATGRLAMRLLELADRFGTPNGNGIQIDVSLSQQDLAGWTGSSREAISKALQSLRKRNIVATERRRITVLDRDALEQRAK